ncbi:hypothetical protein BKA65DRAFT_470802 [Rhexocercosporidium sp. MPI-PUGE-AT-0058]|nr:hypothetical protein BKA65DRAFT_470802 [Rhexocercosporidium sp. MPI-PUGE-AT-0058]
MSLFGFNLTFKVILRWLVKISKAVGINQLHGRHCASNNAEGATYTLLPSLTSFSDRIGIQSISYDVVESNLLAQEFATGRDIPDPSEGKCKNYVVERNDELENSSTKERLPCPLGYYFGSLHTQEQTLLPAKQTFSPNPTHPSKNPSVKKVIHLENASELRKIQSDLFGSSSKSGWVPLSCVGTSVVHFIASGEGPPNDIASHLKDDQIQFGLIHIYVNSAVKDILFEWIGKEVGLIEIWKKSKWAVEIQAFLQPYQAKVVVTNKDRWTPRIIRPIPLWCHLLSFTRGENENGALQSSRATSVILHHEKINARPEH